MKNSTLVTRALLHALGVLAYTALIAAMLSNGSQLFGEGEKSFLIPTAMLTLLVLSAAITGTLVFGKPILLYLDNQKTDAVKLLGWTLGWLAVFTIVVFSILALLK